VDVPGSGLGFAEDRGRSVGTGTGIGVIGLKGCAALVAALLALVDGSDGAGLTPIGESLEVWP
jgi:hypothetical protein